MSEKNLIALYKEGMIDDQVVLDTLDSMDSLEVVDFLLLRSERAEITPAVIPFEHEKMMSFVDQALEKYKNIFVKEEDLAYYEKQVKALGGLAARIDNYRKKRKQEASTGIAAFETKCNELRDLVTKVRENLAKQTAKYEQERREKASKDVQAIIDEVAKEIGLRDAYKEQLTVIDKYTNKGSKEKDTRVDLSHRANSLLAMQKQEDQLEEIRKQKRDLATSFCALQSASEGLTTPITINDLGNLDDIELMSLGDVIGQKVKLQKAVENRAQAAVTPPQSFIPIAKPAEPSVNAEKPPQRYQYTMDLTLFEKTILESFLTEEGIKYEVLS